MNEKKVFISYSRVDLPQVKLLVDVLRDGGYAPWFDHYLEGGRSWKDQLHEAIKHCDLFLYLLTPESVASEWCQWEFWKACAIGKPIVTILQQKRTPLDGMLAQLQYVDLSDGMTPNAIARLMRALNAAEPLSGLALPKEPKPSSGAPARSTDETTPTKSNAPATKPSLSDEKLLRQIDRSWPHVLRALFPLVENKNYDFDRVRPTTVRRNRLSVQVPGDFRVDAQKASDKILACLHDRGFDEIDEVTIEPTDTTL